MAPDDAEILQGCLRGDKKAWDAFVDRYSRLVYWSIWKALGSSAAPDKEDVCREVFQEFFRRILEPSRLEKLSRAQSLRKYLQVTAGHLVLERFRRAGALGRVEVSGLSDEADALTGNPGGEASLAERRRILESVLAALKPNERTCLEMHYLDGHTHREIAGLLGLPQDTVSSLLRRTKDKVRERLEGKGL